MPKLKVLPLEWWMYQKESQIKLHHTFPYFIGRDGYYRLGALAWFEISGERFVSDVYDAIGRFDSRLNNTDEKILRKVELTAIKDVIRFSTDKKLTAPLQKRLQEHEHAVNCREISRNIRKLSLRIRKEVLK